MTESVLTVGQFLDIINELLGTQDFYVVGEVVGAKPHPTGFYFSLKDQDGGGIMDCYLSPYAYRGLGFPVSDGMQVKVGGIPSVYKLKGRFSFRVESLEAVGEGSLRKAYEALKKKLDQEGIFARKRPLPKFIGSIGLITSKTGAVIDDFRRNLAPLGIKVYHRDVRVEGSLASGQIIRAIKDFDRGSRALDVLVVIRGGGSMEDLQAFNNEHVVRAVFGSRIPTIVSIGHDHDVPLAQMAADASASTPTATVVLINASWERLRLIERTGQQLAYAFGNAIEQVRQTITSAERHISAASPERQLRLGYSIVTDQTGAAIRSIAQLRHNQTVTTRLAKGSFISEIKELQSGHGKEK